MQLPFAAGGGNTNKPLVEINPDKTVIPQAASNISGITPASADSAAAP
jgi:hypothetical protein